MNIKVCALFCMLLGISSGVYGADKKNDELIQRYIMKHFNEIPTEVFNKHMQEKVVQGIKTVSSDYHALAAYLLSKKSNLVLQRSVQTKPQRQKLCIQEGPELNRYKEWDADGLRTTFVKRELRTFAGGENAWVTLKASKLIKDNNFSYEYTTSLGRCVNGEAAQKMFKRFEREYIC